MYYQKDRLNALRINKQGFFVVNRLITMRVGFYFPCILSFYNLITGLFVCWIIVFPASPAEIRDFTVLFKYEAWLQTAPLFKGFGRVNLFCYNGSSTFRQIYSHVCHSHDTESANKYLRTKLRLKVFQMLYIFFSFFSVSFSICLFLLFF